MNSIKKIAIVVAVLIIAVAVAAFMQHQNMNKIKSKLSSGNGKGFALVELFTSEGCSSCPPADMLVEKVQKEYPDQPIYILAYHVDYWDRYGWKDLFSDAAYSARQKQYADWLHVETIYTPQIVINGKKELVGSDEAALLSGITAGVKAVPATQLTLESKVADGRIMVNYETDAPLQKAQLVLALVQRSAATQIKGGENEGRTLTHVQIVRKLVTETLRTHIGKTSIMLPKDYATEKWELIGFVQNTSSGAILSASRPALEL